MKTTAALVLAAMMATAAHAQPTERVSLGAGIGFHDYRDGAFSSKSPTVVPEYRLALTRHSNRQGLSFGLKGGLGYSTPDRMDFIGGVETKTGNLRMVPVMVGAGPSYRTGPVRVGMDVVAGPSFNNFSVDDAARAAYRDRLGVTLNSIKVQNSVAVRSDMSLWYDLTERIGLHTSVGYTVNRPMVKTTVDGVTTSTRWTTDRLGYQAGLAFGVF